MPPAKKRARVVVTAADLRAAPGDPRPLQIIMALQSFDAVTWLEQLDGDGVKAYLKELEARRDLDHAIQVTTDHIQEMKAITAELERVEKRVSAGEQYMRSLVGAALTRFSKGEWLQLVRSKVR